MKPAPSMVGFLYNKTPSRFDTGQVFNQQVLPWMSTTRAQVGNPLAVGGILKYSTITPFLLGLTAWKALRKIFPSQAGSTSQ